MNYNYIMIVISNLFIPLGIYMKKKENNSSKSKPDQNIDDFKPIIIENLELIPYSRKMIDEIIKNNFSLKDQLEDLFDFLNNKPNTSLSVESYKVLLKNIINGVFNINIQNWANGILQGLDIKLYEFEPPIVFQSRLIATSNNFPKELQNISNSLIFNEVNLTKDIFKYSDFTFSSSITKLIFINCKFNNLNFQLNSLIKIMKYNNMNIQNILLVASDFQNTQQIPIDIIKLSIENKNLIFSQMKIKDSYDFLIQILTQFKSYDLKFKDCLWTGSFYDIKNFNKSAEIFIKDIRKNHENSLISMENITKNIGFTEKPLGEAEKLFLINHGIKYEIQEDIVNIAINQPIQKQNKQIIFKEINPTQLLSKVKRKLNRIEAYGSPYSRAITSQINGIIKVMTTDPQSKDIGYHKDRLKKFLAMPDFIVPIISWGESYDRFLNFEIKQKSLFLFNCVVNPSEIKQIPNKDKITLIEFNNTYFNDSLLLVLLDLNIFPCLNKIIIRKSLGFIAQSVKDIALDSGSSVEVVITDENNEAAAFQQMSRVKGYLFSIFNMDIIGMEKIKDMFIVQMLTAFSFGEFGKTICLIGVPGTGKTTIFKYARMCLFFLELIASYQKKFKCSMKEISDDLLNEFRSIAIDKNTGCFNRFGGDVHVNQIHSPDQFKGHDKVFQGSEEGHIAKALIKNIADSNSMKINLSNGTSFVLNIGTNGLLFDEIDKAQNRNGTDVSMGLLEVLDGQGVEFMDLYLRLMFNLSSVFKICTANRLSEISTTLLSRLQIEYVNGATNLEKYIILEKIIKDLGIDLNGAHILIEKSFKDLIIYLTSSTTDIRTLKSIMEFAMRVAVTNGVSIIRKENSSSFLPLSLSSVISNEEDTKQPGIVFYSGQNSEGTINIIKITVGPFTSNSQTNIELLTECILSEKNYGRGQVNIHSTFQSLCFAVIYSLSQNLSLKTRVLNRLKQSTSIYLSKPFLFSDIEFVVLYSLVGIISMTLGKIPNSSVYYLCGCNNQGGLIVSDNIIEHAKIILNFFGDRIKTVIVPNSISPTLEQRLISEIFKDNIVLIKLSTFDELISKLFNTQNLTS